MDKTTSYSPGSPPSTGRQIALVSRVIGNAVDDADARSEGGVRIQAPFNPAYLAALKVEIPFTYRRWLSDLQVFAIAHPYEETAIEVASRFFVIQHAKIEDEVSLADRFWSEPPRPGEAFHQRPILKTTKGRYKP